MLLFSSFSDIIEIDSHHISAFSYTLFKISSLLLLKLGLILLFCRKNGFFYYYPKATGLYTVYILRFLNYNMY